MIKSKKTDNHKSLQKKKGKLSEKEESVEENVIEKDQKTPKKKKESDKI